MKERKRWEFWMGSFLLVAVLILSTMGVKKTVEDAMAQDEEKNVIVLDAGHGGGKKRKDMQMREK